MTFGFDCAIAMPIRPSVVVGRPSPLPCVHVLPASVVFHSPLPGPPLESEYGVRTRCQLAANSTSLLDGSIATSMNPALSDTNLMSCPVFPPSVVLERPRSGFADHAWPSAATYTVFGSFGLTTMRPIAPVFSSPMRVHVRPPSVDLKMPHPGEIVLRESSSPVPAHTCIVSDGAIASSPIETHGWLSNTGRNVVPAFVVFQIPPAAAAMKNDFDGLGIPTTLDGRPPMFAGPMLRQRNPASSVESSVMPPAFDTPVEIDTFAGGWRRGSAVRRRCVGCAGVVSVEVGRGCGGAGGF